MRTIRIYGDGNEAWHVALPNGEYGARSARDAQTMDYGERDYWDYLERHAQEMRDYWLRHGDTARADEMMTRTLAESLAGNDS